MKWFADYPQATSYQQFDDDILPSSKAFAQRASAGYETGYASVNCSNDNRDQPNKTPNTHEKCTKRRLET
jgi:hypothetical protein